jgi:predicted ArsR family transcriptional regulator
VNKSSDGLENLTAAATATDRLLYLLKMRGPQTSAALGSLLRITGEAVRQQLLRLAADGLVSAQAERSGVGRPRQVWTLTEAGVSRFPDAHALVAIQLIRGVRDLLGEAALDTLISARESETKTAYAIELAGAKNLRERVIRLAAIRTREGYMAEWHEEADGRYLFVENHCPICAAATACQGFCRAELSVFRESLGGGLVQVDRTEHIVEGARRCAYIIQSQTAAPSEPRTRRRALQSKDKPPGLRPRGVGRS